MTQIQYKHLTREAKEASIEYFLSLWFEFHESYVQKLSEYESEIEIKKSKLQEGECLRQAHKKSYRPKWSAFLLFGTEKEVVDYFSHCQIRTFRCAQDEIFRENVLYLMRNLNVALQEVRRYNKRGSDLTHSEFGMIPSSCGTGRHQVSSANDITQRSYGRYYWPR